MEIEVRWEDDHIHHRTTMVVWDVEPPVWKINPDWRLDRKIPDRLPDTFRCFVCLVQFPQTKIGGRYHDHWICTGCIPYMSEWAVGCLVAWERYRHPGKLGDIFKVPGLSRRDRQALAAKIRSIRRK